MSGQCSQQVAAASRSSMPGLLTRLSRDRSASVTMIFSLLLLPLTGLIGFAVDYGRVLHVRYQAQSALDAAALAAGRVAQVERTDMINKASQAAGTFYDLAKPKDVLSSTLTFSPNDTQTEFTVSSNTWVRTPFLSVLDYLLPQHADQAAPDECKTNYYACMRVATSATAQLKVGGNGENSLEISMMLDVTGSMEGQKLTDLKSAAKDLIDIVIWDDQSTATSKLAVVPFAEAVNVGSTTLADKVRGAVRTDRCLTKGAACTFITGTTDSTTEWVWGKPATWYKFTKSSGSGTYSYKISSYCVTERTGTNAYTDTAPSATSDVLGPAYLGSANGENCDLVDTSDAEVNSITPLSTDKVLLKRKIDKLKISGSTAGHLGTAWAWYMLSPNWGYLWPTASKPADYGTANLKKIAILMTDGDYNTEYCKGAEAKDSNSAKINCNSTNGASNDQAATLCTKIKAKGIEVYTVGFQVSSAAKTRLKTCATDSSHYYDATSGDALRAAFRDIALKISILRLAK